eukprot:m.223179 g.223179  ORF g.223179 m.223179 type:complete len:393 (+) comp15137_c0_seq13:130-1308(+)
MRLRLPASPSLSHSVCGSRWAGWIGMRWLGSGNWCHSSARDGSWDVGVERVETKRAGDVVEWEDGRVEQEASDRVSLLDVAHLPPLTPPDEPENAKTATVAIVGVPNVGKSTLLNSILVRKVAAVSPKCHTTRYTLCGVWTLGEHQVVFLDTPGLIPFSEGRKLRVPKTVSLDASSSLLDADVVASMVCDFHVKGEPSRWTKYLNPLSGVGSETLELLESKQRALIINKTDLLSNTKALDSFVELAHQQMLAPGVPLYDHIFTVSARTGHNINAFKEYLLGCCQPGRWLHNSQDFTSSSLYEIILEAVREQMFMRYRKEIPYIVEHRLVSIDVVDSTTVDIRWELTVPSKSILRIVIGNKGSRLKHVAMFAEKALSATLDQPVKLHLEVVVA